MRNYGKDGVSLLTSLFGEGEGEGEVVIIELLGRGGGGFFPVHWKEGYEI